MRTGVKSPPTPLVIASWASRWACGLGRVPRRRFPRHGQAEKTPSAVTTSFPAAALRTSKRASSVAATRSVLAYAPPATRRSVTSAGAAVEPSSAPSMAGVVGERELLARTLMAQGDADSVTLLRQVTS
jgi:hypothetical protein